MRRFMIPSSCCNILRRCRTAHEPAECDCGRRLQRRRARKWPACRRPAQA